MPGYFRAQKGTDTDADHLAESILAISLVNGITAIAVIVGMAFWKMTAHRSTPTKPTVRGLTSGS